MKKKKMIKLPLIVNKKLPNEISEVRALLDVMKAIKIKESELKKRNGKQDEEKKEQIG